MDILIIIAAIVGGILTLWALILTLFVGHRLLEWLPVKPANMPVAEWDAQRRTAGGITWLLPSNRGPSHDGEWQSKPDTDPKAPYFEA